MSEWRQFLEPLSSVFVILRTERETRRVVGCPTGIDIEWYRRGEGDSMVYINLQKEFIFMWE